MMLFSLMLVGVAILIHAVGHQLVAWILGVKLKWKWKRYRLLWCFEGVRDYTVMQVVRFSGFLFEFAFVLFCAYYVREILPGLVTLIRFAVHPICAGRWNDFERI